MKLSEREGTQKSSNAKYLIIKILPIAVFLPEGLLDMKLANSLLQVKLSSTMSKVQMIASRSTSVRLLQYSMTSEGFVFSPPAENRMSPTWCTEL